VEGAALSARLLKWAMSFNQRAPTARRRPRFAEQRPAQRAAGSGKECKDFIGHMHRAKRRCEPKQWHQSWVTDVLI
jgi:hypothetical protein